MLARASQLVRRFIDLFRRPLRRQAAALCWRYDGAGNIEILLVTTRTTKRWTPPRGWPMDGRSLADAAKIEATEEAGVIGEVQEKPIGHYRYNKGENIGDVLVVLYPLRVDALEGDYREVGQRKRRWFSSEAAAEAVNEPELKSLLRVFAP